MGPERERTSLWNYFRNTWWTWYFRGFSLSVVLLQTSLLHHFSDFLKEVLELGILSIRCPGQRSSVKRLELHDSSIITSYGSLWEHVGPGYSSCPECLCIGILCYITNYHKPSSLKEYMFTVSVLAGQKFENGVSGYHNVENCQPNCVLNWRARLGKIIHPRKNIHHIGCGQNSFPCRCRTEGLRFLVIGVWQLPSASYHVGFLAFTFSESATEFLEWVY